ncbi:MAG: carboxymuconolactone decarboxylase family protein [Pseudonocardiales bacterium]|nr:carboxymuconolactone decarboxylase family protein [Pseudonocardiales bacterium]
MSAPTAPPQSIAALTELLEQTRKASGGRLLALHTDLARSPAVLAAYLGVRRAGGDYRTLAPTVRAAIMLAVGAANDGTYSQAIATQLAISVGMSPEQTVAVRTGQVADAHLAALLAVMREAPVNTGRVTDAAWAAATTAGWSTEQLIEAFVFLALTVFVDYFTHYARTDLDVPPAPPVPSEGSIR